MNTNKLLLGTLLGGVAFFLLGWLLYGFVFKSMLDSMNPGLSAVMRPDAEFDIVAMIVGSLGASFLLAYIFEKWANIRTFMGGLVAGGTIFFLVAFGYDSQLHAASTLFTWSGVLLDSVVYAILGALSGGLIGWWLGYNRA